MAGWRDVKKEEENIKRKAHKPAAVGIQEKQEEKT